MATKTFVILIVNVCLVYAVKRCCDDENNFLTTDLKQCLDGSKIDIAPACTLFAVEEDLTSTRVDSEGVLYLDGEPVPRHQYCYASDQNTTKHLYVLCGDDDSDETSIDILKNVCEMISVFFMILTVVIYISLPPMMDLQGEAIVNSISGKALAYLTLVAIYIIPYLEDVSCYIAAYFLYISFLYAFFWLNILCFQIWRQVVNPPLLNHIKNWKMVYYIYGIGGPIFCWAVLTLIQHSDFEPLKHVHPGIGEIRCWFKTMREQMIYFYTPISILITTNIIYFVWTIVVLSKQYTNSRTNQVFKYR
ncbi:unnamed protein product [Acanthoscelides obtectus]|nr:unnamed protein product [Acanthoscelides obtectus]CAK1644013.1 G-protein coupled receptor Mth2 [Acanthoscelides obtectus]